MNRRPNQSRTGYDSFTPSHAGRFTASTPDAHFFEQRKKKSTGMRIFLALLFLLAALLVLNLIFNQFVHIEKLEVPVRGLSEIFDGYTILHLSDLKGDSFGNQQQLFALSLKNTHFDTVLITGDMISPDGDAEAFYELLDQLHEINPAAPVYMIAGDSDPTPASLTYAGGGSPFAPWVLGAQQRHAQLLDAPQAIRREGQTLWLTSSTHLNLDLDTMQHRFEEQYAHSRTSGDTYEAELAIHNLKWLEETRAARAEITDPDILITLMHTPPTAEELQSARSGSLLPPVDLLLCGHYLGGMMRLPILGPLFIPSSHLPRYGLFPGADAHYGLHRDGSTNVYINSGLCSTSSDYPSFFFRLNNPPTAALLRLTPSAL